MPIKYIKGDATIPIDTKNSRMIVHVCNNLGRWEKGFVMDLSKRYQEPERSYRSMKNYTLGSLQFVKIDDKLHVCNMIAQNGVKTLFSFKKKFVDYNALKVCLKKVGKICRKNKFSVHMPKIGIKLGGGNWNIIANIILETLRGLDIYIYNLV